MVESNRKESNSKFYYPRGGSRTSNIEGGGVTFVLYSSLYSDNIFVDSYQVGQ